MLAADQFLVARPHALGADPGGNSDPAVTVIAGYPWFADWGRDTMIALPGLTLATGRYGEARGLLRTFAGFVDQGMLPNRFPEEGGAAEYNTVDATLWYFVALGRYLEATQDWALLTELFPLLTDIVGWHERGTRYGIGVDPTDGLLRAGAPGVQLTWMDAKVDDWVVTPRRGKLVEINALWHAALSRMCDWAARRGQAAAPYEAQRAAVAQSFFARFWYPAGGYLYDVVDVEGQRGALDWSLRPNQLFVLALAPRHGRAHAADATGSAHARPRRFQFQGQLSRRPARARRGVSPGHRLALAAGRVCGRLPHGSWRGGPASRPAGAVSRASIRGRHRKHQRSRGRRTAVPSWRLYRPGMERGGAAAHSDGAVNAAPPSHGPDLCACVFRRTAALKTASASQRPSRENQNTLANSSAVPTKKPPSSARPKAPFR